MTRIEKTQEYILPVDQNIGLKHSLAFQNVYQDYQKKRQNYKQKRFNGFPKIMEDYKDYSSVMSYVEFDIDMLNDRSYRRNQAMLYFAIYLPTRFLDHSNLAKRLGFLTREEVHKERLNPEIPILPMTSRLAVEMGYVKRIEIILISEETGKVHPDYGNEYSTTEVYSRSFSFPDIRDELFDTTIDIPYPNDPKKHFRYRIAEITKLAPGIVNSDW